MEEEDLPVLSGQGIEVGQVLSELKCVGLLKPEVGKRLSWDLDPKTILATRRMFSLFIVLGVELANGRGPQKAGRFPDGGSLQD